MSDAQVKQSLQESESEQSDGSYRAWRSYAGEPFLVRNQGFFDKVASVNELFMELHQPVDDAEADVAPHKALKAVA